MKATRQKQEERFCPGDLVKLGSDSYIYGSYDKDKQTFSRRGSEKIPHTNVVLVVPPLVAAFVVSEQGAGWIMCDDRDRVVK